MSHQWNCKEEALGAVCDWEELIAMFWKAPFVWLDLVQSDDPCHSLVFNRSQSSLNPISNWVFNNVWSNSIPGLCNSFSFHHTTVLIITRESSSFDRACKALCPSFVALTVSKAGATWMYVWLLKECLAIKTWHYRPPLERNMQSAWILLLHWAPRGFPWKGLQVLSFRGF